MHAERRFQPGQHRRPFAGRNEARDMAMAGDIVAEHDDDIGVQRVGALDDRLDAIAATSRDRRHECRRSTAILSWKSAGHCGGDRVIARDAKPQHRLDAEAIGRGRGAEGAEAADEPEEMTSRDHGCSIVMQLIMRGD